MICPCVFFLQGQIGTQINKRVATGNGTAQQQKGKTQCENKTQQTKCFFVFVVKVKQERSTQMHETPADKSLKERQIPETPQIEETKSRTAKLQKTKNKAQTKGKAQTRKTRGVKSQTKKNGTNGMEQKTGLRSKLN